MGMQLGPSDRLLVLGSSGFIGSHLPDVLAAAGVEMVGFDLHPNARPDVTTHLGDMRDAEALTEAMEGRTAVLNLAAAHHDFGISTATFESVNVGGARNVCAAMDHHGITNLCFYSSVAVYGEHATPPNETTTPTPVNDYGRTKLAAEGVYLGWQRAETGRRALIIRPAVVFGPRNFANVYRLIQQIDRRRFLPVGPGANRKSMCFVTNIVEAILYLWTAPSRAADGEAEIYNYVDKPDLTSHQVVSEIYADLGRREPPLRVPLAPALWAAKPFELVAKVTGHNLPITSARIAKLSEAETSFAADKVRAAGFTPPVSLPEGLRRMVRWYLDGGRTAAPVVHLPPEELAPRG